MNTKQHKRHVLVVTHLYPSRSADCAGIFVHRLNVGLRSHGWHVSVLQMTEWAPPGPLRKLSRAWERAYDRETDLLTELDDILVHHPRVFTPRPSRWFPDDDREREIRALVNYCRSREDLATADIVLGHFLVPDGYHAMRLGRSLGIPSAAMGWGIDVDEWPRENPVLLERLRDAIDGLDTPIACSKRMVSDANAFLRTPRSDWEVVYAGIDLERFYPDGGARDGRSEVFSSRPELRDANAKIALMIAAPLRLKGYLELLDAWKEVEPVFPDWHLVMTGFREGEVDVLHEIESRDLARANWLGAVSVESIPELLRASDAFVLPSHYEGLSIALMEAMATGLPVITTDVGGHAEVVKDGREGWLIGPGDHAALRAALTEMMRSPTERARRGLAARAAAKAIGSVTDNAARLSAVLERCLTQSARRTA